MVEVPTYLFCTVSTGLRLVRSIISWTLCGRVYFHWLSGSKFKDCIDQDSSHPVLQTYILYCSQTLHWCYCLCSLGWPFLYLFGFHEPQPQHWWCHHCSNLKLYLYYFLFYCADPIHVGCWTCRLNIVGAIISSVSLTSLYLEDSVVQYWGFKKVPKPIILNRTSGVLINWLWYL